MSAPGKGFVSQSTPIIRARAASLNAAMTTELATEALEDIASKQPKTITLPPALVLETVAESFQLTASDLKSRQRDKRAALARQIAMYLLRQPNNLSLTQIGREFGNREPITVSQACKKIAAGFEADPDLRQEILTIQQRLSQKQKVKAG